MAGAFGPTRRSQPYRRGVREPGMALRNMMQGRPNFQPNPMALERATMRQRHGGLAGALRGAFRDIRGPGQQGPAVRGGMVERYGDGNRRGLGREGALRMRQARGIGQFRDGVGQVPNVGPGGVDPSDASRQGFFDRERQLGMMEQQRAAMDPRALELARRSGDRFGALGGVEGLEDPARDRYRSKYGHNFRQRHPFRDRFQGPIY